MLWWKGNLRPHGVGTSPEGAELLRFSCPHSGSYDEPAEQETETQHSSLCVIQNRIFGLDCVNVEVGLELRWTSLRRR